MSAGAGRSRISAGILLYRRIGGPLEVLLAHPGGPFFVHKDEGHWTIPKGEIEPGETEAGEGGAPLADAALLAVARREFAEETGHEAPLGPGLALGSIVQKGGKVVHAWAFEGDLDPTTARSNTFELSWPPGSGKTATFPEIDRVAWFDLAEARRRIKPTQIPLLDRLESLVIER
jgi:predicted NUDIX family NTP pyrophosphohydrolase